MPSQSDAVAPHQNLPSRDVEVRRLVERAAAVRDPVGDQRDHLVDAPRRVAEHRLHARRIAQQRRRRLRSRRIAARCPSASRTAPPASATRHRGPARHVEHQRRRAARAERPERDRVRVALPDHVDVAHAEVDRFSRAHPVGDVPQHAVAQIDGIVEPQDRHRRAVRSGRRTRAPAPARVPTARTRPPARWGRSPRAPPSRWT